MWHIAFVGRLIVIWHLGPKELNAMSRLGSKVIKLMGNWYHNFFPVLLIVGGKRWGEAFWKFSKIGNDNYFGLHVSFHFHHIWAKSDQKWRGGYKNTEKWGFSWIFFRKIDFSDEYQSQWPWNLFLSIKQRLPVSFHAWRPVLSHPVKSYSVDKFSLNWWRNEKLKKFRPFKNRIP